MRREGSASCRRLIATLCATAAMLALTVVAGCTPKPVYPRGSDDYPRCSATRYVIYFHSGGKKDARPTGLYCIQLDSLRAQMIVPGVCWYDWVPGTDSLIVRASPYQGTRVISFRKGTGRDLPWNVTPGTVSPDGRWMAFDSGGHGRTTISLMNLTTGDVRNITPDSMLYASPSWSPAGNSLVVTGGSTRASGILIIDTLGTPLRRLVAWYGDLRSPVWSPRGEAIAWVNAAGNGRGLNVIDTLGANTRYVGPALSSVCWEPDGDALIYSGATRDGTGLFEYRLSTGHVRRLTF